MSARTVEVTDPIIYVPSFYNKHLADTMFEDLQRIEWEKRPDAPRQEYWCNDFGQSYTYGKGRGQRTYQAKQFPEWVLAVRATLNNYHRVFYEGCFLNKYGDDHSSLGWHADDDPGIDHTKPIAVITVGQPRALQIMPQNGPKDVAEVLLEHGSLLLMRPGMQQTHFHRIPKAGFKAGTRISLTFRGLIPGRVKCQCGEAWQSKDGWAAQGLFEDVPPGDGSKEWGMKIHRLAPEMCSEHKE